MRTMSQMYCIDTIRQGKIRFNVRKGRIVLVEL